MDLTEKEAAVYKWLLEHEERLSQEQLADRLDINRMAVSRALATLEEVRAIEAEHTAKGIVMSSVRVVLQPKELQAALMARSPLTTLMEE